MTDNKNIKSSSSSSRAQFFLETNEINKKHKKKTSNQNFDKSEADSSENEETLPFNSSSKHTRYPQTNLVTATSATSFNKNSTQIGNSTVGARLNSIYSNSVSYKMSKSLEEGCAAANGDQLMTKKEQIQYYYNKILVAISHSINIIKAVMMRCVFSLHSLIAIIYVFLVKKDEWYFVNVIGVVFMMIELFVTIIKRKGKTLLL
jgi:hypothetical protein